MLVLSRNHGESITIGENIRITVLNAGRKQAKIGIEAPKDMAIKRTDNKPKEAANDRR